MTQQDFFVTPLYILLVYLVAFFFYKSTTDERTRKYYFPALTVKIVGALALGFIYQFYYSGGDTFNYFHHGSKYIYKAFTEDPGAAFQLLFSSGKFNPSTYNYAQHIWYYTDPASYFIVKIAGFFDILTFHTYSATAVLFAGTTFTGVWALFKAFYKIYPALHKHFAIACFFIPSVFFWGSGLMKDPVTLAALGWLTACVIAIFRFRKNILINSIVAIIMAMILVHVKIYILMSFIPALLFWLAIEQLHNIKSVAIKVLVFPFIIFISAGMMYIALREVGEDSSRYSLEKISQTAEVTARWISYVSETEGGAGYSLGDFDYSISGMIKKSPQAIWVTLFRPHPWEIKNALMLLSGIESLIFLIITVRLLIVTKIKNIGSALKEEPIITFCLVFSIIFAFAVGISTYNFGSLARYKIPLMPYYLMALFIISYQVKLAKTKKRERILRMLRQMKT